MVLSFGDECLDGRVDGRGEVPPCPRGDRRVALQHRAGLDGQGLVDLVHLPVAPVPQRDDAGRAGVEHPADGPVRLLDAAADVFARRGFHATTVDDVADAAGHTKGAVYSNFAGKEALFLALLDRHLDDQFAEIDRLAATASDSELRARLRDASAEQMGPSGSFGLLMLEFWLYAARDEAARDALAERVRLMRERLAEVIADRDAAHGTTRAMSPEDAASLVLALDAGLFLQQLIDEQAISPSLRAEAIADVIDGAARS